MQRSCTLFEFGKILNKEDPPVNEDGSDICVVPPDVFSWLENKCFKADAFARSGLKRTQHEGRAAIQVTSYVGVLRAPCGYQIEVLPKIGRVDPEAGCARQRLIEMLRCLSGFRHIREGPAELDTTPMPLLEVFIQEFLASVETVVKRGLRSDYAVEQNNLFALRGKLLVAHQIAQNLLRRDRFYTEHDQFSQNRAENRLIHAALRRALGLAQALENQRLARELCFVFSEVPLPVDVGLDLQRISPDREMAYYEPALRWAKLILKELSPVSVAGQALGSSLLFPMEKLFEAFVAKHLKRQLSDGLFVDAQERSQHLVEHQTHDWFQLRPDLLVRDDPEQPPVLLLDTKWKLLDSKKSSTREKYDLSQADFYQLYAYGHHYLKEGEGDLILVYPKTVDFQEPLQVFNFHKPNNKLRLWVLPFCLEIRRLMVPENAPFKSLFP